MLQATYKRSQNIALSGANNQNPEQIDQAAIQSGIGLAKSSAVYWFHYRSTRIHEYLYRSVTKIRDDILSSIGHRNKTYI